MIVIHTGTDKIERRFIVHLITLKDLEYAQKNKPNDLVFIFPLEVDVEPIEVPYKSICGEKL